MTGAGVLFVALVTTVIIIFTQCGDHACRGFLWSFAISTTDIKSAASGGKHDPYSLCRTVAQNKKVSTIRNAENHSAYNRYLLESFYLHYFDRLFRLGCSDIFLCDS